MVPRQRAYAALTPWDRSPANQLSTFAPACDRARRNEMQPCLPPARGRALVEQARPRMSSGPLPCMLAPAPATCRARGHNSISTTTVIAPCWRPGRQLPHQQRTQRQANHDALAHKKSMAPTSPTCTRLCAVMTVRLPSSFRPCKKQPPKRSRVPGHPFQSSDDDRGVWCSSTGVLTGIIVEASFMQASSSCTRCARRAFSAFNALHSVPVRTASLPSLCVCSGAFRKHPNSSLPAVIAQLLFWCSVVTYPQKLEDQNVVMTARLNSTCP